jgi:hypothetical protein
LKAPFKDKKGQSCASLILQSSAYVDRENRRFGMVSDFISLQDEINKRRSKALHLLSVNRIITEQGAVEDVDKAKREMAKPDGAIAVLPGMRFELLPGGDLAQGSSTCCSMRPPRCSWLARMPRCPAPTTGSCPAARSWRSRLAGTSRMNRSPMH